jgi:uncharacterized protein YjbJ (UPF0337 family)
MDRDRIKGKFDEAKGKLKEGAGKATGNDRLRAEGKLDKTKGKIEETFGKAKDKIRSASEAYRPAGKHLKSAVRTWSGACGVPACPQIHASTKMRTWRPPSGVLTLTVSPWRSMQTSSVSPPT